MMVVRRFIGSILVLMLVTSIFTVVPYTDRFGVIELAGADYIGFESDGYVNDDSTDLEQAAVAMAQYNNDVYLVWHDKRNGDFDIFLSKSTDGGATWGDGLINNNDIRVDDTDRNLNNTDNETNQKYPAVAVDTSGNLYVVWQDDREARGDNDIYFAKSTDGGATFGTNTRADDNGTGQFDQAHPTIFVDSNDIIYLAWEDSRNSKTDSDIYFSRSDDGGATFDPNVLVDDDTSLRLQKFPKLAVKVDGVNTDIYLVWQDERAGSTNWDIYFSKSIDDGATWGDGLDNDNDVMINDNMIGAQEHPAVALDASDNLIVFWDDEREGNYKTIYKSVSADGGSTWTTNTNMTDAYTDNSDQTHPVISIDNNYIGVAWVDNRNNPLKSDVFFAISDDNGATFGPFLQANQGPKDSISTQPAIIFNGPNTAYIAWEDNRNETKGLDIFFAKSTMIILQAPDLSTSAFTPASGQYATQFHFTVVYTDIEEDPPAVGYPKLFLFKDAAGAEPVAGSPFTLFRQLDPWQDGLYSNGEIFEQRITLFEEYDYHYYIEAVANYGNLTHAFTSMAKGPFLDRQNVTYSGAFPDEVTWHSSMRVKCGISVKDVGFAGVEALSIEYRITTNGTSNFENWKNDARLNRTITPTGVNVSGFIYFEEGANNYIQWRGKDKFDNGPNESAVYRIKVDTSPVMFSDPLPDPAAGLWFNNELVEVGITVTDTAGIGVNASTIEYAYSTTGKGSFGVWQNAAATSDGLSVPVTAEITFANGSNNYVKWRAYDLLGNGPNETLPYRIRIDTRLADIIENHPPEPPSNIMPNTTIDRRPRITWEPGTDEDSDPLTYVIQIGTSSGGSEYLPWTNAGSELFYQALSNMNVGVYYIQLQSFDGFDYSTVAESRLDITIDGNNIPTPPTDFAPLYTTDKRPAMSWSGATDADAEDALIYYVQIGTGATLADVLPLRHIGFNEFYDYKETPLAFGIYYVRILATDGKDWSEPADFVMKIADYNLELTTDSPVSITQATSKTLVLSVANLGSADDTITLSYGDELEGHANLSFSANGINLVPDANTTVDLKITALPTATPADYYLKLTATSEDGITNAEFTVIVTITETTTNGPPDGNGQNGDGDDSDEQGLENFIKGSFFWLILIIIIIIIAVGVYFGARGKRKEKDYDKDRRRDDYERMYARDRGYPRDGYPTQPQAPSASEQQQLPPDQYYDEYGAPQLPPPEHAAYPGEAVQPYEQGAAPEPALVPEEQLDEVKVTLPESEPSDEFYEPEDYESEMEISEDELPKKPPKGDEELPGPLPEETIDETPEGEDIAEKPAEHKDKSSEKDITDNDEDE